MAVRRTRPPRILMTADSVGGVWQYALELIHALGRQEVEVSLATMGRRLSASQRMEIKQAPVKAVFESEFKLAWMDDPWNDVDAASRWLLDIAERLEPDVVHLNDFSHGDLPWPAPVLMVGHSCVLSWWQAVHGEQAPAAYERYRETTRRGLQAAHLVVAPSHSMLHALQRHYGIASRACVIANGRRPGLWKYGAKQPFIFAAGRVWDAGKNLEALASIAGRLPWPVCIAGEDRSPDGRHLALSSVRFLGHLSTASLASWLGKASIYALPARYEPFGLSILEAAHCGCALVLGDIASLREIWQEAAIYVAPDDPDALESALRRLIELPGLREHYGNLARAQAHRYQPDTMAQAYAAAYEELAHPSIRLRRTAREALPLSVTQP